MYRERQISQGNILKASIVGLVMDLHCIDRLLMPWWIGDGLAKDGHLAGRLMQDRYPFDNELADWSEVGNGLAY